MLSLEISPEELRQSLATASDGVDLLVLIDCREQEEYDLVHIEGSLLFPLSELLQRQDELNSLKDRQLVVYCHHGMRSWNAVSWLREQGFDQAQSLQGGIDAWAAKIEPDMKRY